MVNQIRKCGCLTAMALLCFAAVTFAQEGAMMKKPVNPQKAPLGSLAPATFQSTSGRKAASPGEISQKLAVTVPESPLLMILASDLVGLAALVFLSRRRKVWVRS